MEKNISEEQSKILGTLNILDYNTNTRKQIVYCFLGDYYPVYVAENGELLIDTPTGKINMTKYCKMSVIALNENEKALPINKNLKSINIRSRRVENFDMNNVKLYNINKTNTDNSLIFINGLQFIDNDKLAVNMNIFKYHSLTDEKVREWQNEIKSIKQQCKKLKKENKKIEKGYEALISNIDMDKDVFKFYNSYMEDMRILGKSQFEQFNFFNVTNNTDVNVKYVDIYYYTNRDKQVKMLKDVIKSCKKLTKQYLVINNNPSL